MANNSFRSDRGRDPLAELARLIGQGDPSSGGSSRDSYGTSRPRASAAREPDWAPEEHYDPAPGGDARYAAQSPSDPYASPVDHQAQDRYQEPGYQIPVHTERAPLDERYSAQASHRQAYQDQAHQDQDPAYQNQGYPSPSYRDEGQEPGYGEPAGIRFFSGPAGQFNGFREEPSLGLHSDYDQAPAQMPPAHDLPVFPFAAGNQRYEGDEQYDAEDSEAADHAYREPRRFAPRSVLVAVMAVFALVVVGSAGAFGYRAMFGGSVLPTLPPIIKASNGPNKIALDPQAGAAANAQSVATTGSTENLVSREEQPVTIEAPKAVPRVVATIPVAGSGQNSLPAGINGIPATAGQNGPNRVASADPPWPGQAVASVAPAAQAPAAAPPPQPVQVSSEPKKIRTVTIRNDQTGAVPDTATAAARTPVRSAAAPKAAAGTGAAPMSIVPGQGDAAPAPAPRVRTAVTSSGAAASAGGGSYVQVTSRRTEGEAQAEFRALQGRFPDQLSGREAVIRRADLGEKGTFFRAYVGPFASPEEAAQLCGGLKAAGGNCIVQRN
jgi:hypothetical protein